MVLDTVLNVDSPGAHGTRGIAGWVEVYFPERPLDGVEDFRRRPAAVPSPSLPPRPFRPSRPNLGSEDAQQRLHRIHTCPVVFSPPNGIGGNTSTPSI